MSSNTVKTSLVLVLYTGGTIGMKKRNENGTFQGYLPYATVFLFYGPDCRYHAGVNPLSRIKKVLTKLACLQTLHFLFRDHRAHICAIREILRMAFIFELPPPAFGISKMRYSPHAHRISSSKNPVHGMIWIFSGIAQYKKLQTIILLNRAQKS